MFQNSQTGFFENGVTTTFWWSCNLEIDMIFFSLSLGWNGRNWQLLLSLAVFWDLPLILSYFLLDMWLFLAMSFWSKILAGFANHLKQGLWIIRFSIPFVNLVTVNLLHFLQLWLPFSICFSMDCFGMDWSRKSQILSMFGNFAISFQLLLYFSPLYL